MILSLTIENTVSMDWYGYSSDHFDFDVTNTNCQTCIEAAQLSLEQDLIAEPIEEGGIGMADYSNNCGWNK
jgi:hypothetical protein